MFEIGVTFTFHATRKRFRYERGSSTGPQVRHYKVSAVLTAEGTREDGRAQGHGVLAEFKSVVLVQCSMRHLNDVYPFIEPTNENLAFLWYTTLGDYLSRARADVSGMDDVTVTSVKVWDEWLNGERWAEYYEARVEVEGASS